MRALSLLLLPVSAFAGGPSVTVSGSCPGPLTIDVSGIAPGATVAILKGAGPGADIIPGGPCSGDISGLAGLAYVTSVRDSDGDGLIRLSPTLPGPACAQSIQVLDAASCALTPATPLGGASCDDLAPSYASSGVIFNRGALGSTFMTGAFDGTDVHFSSGGSSSGVRLSRYAADGRFIADYEPGIDIRSVFTMGDGTSPTYVRGFGSPIIYREISPGVYEDDVVLAGGSLDAQSAVVWDDTRGTFVAMLGGQVNTWSAAGASLGEVTLSGYVDSGYPQNRGIAVSNAGCWMTYDAGVVTTWDERGNRLADTALIDGPTDFDSYFSFSYAAGQVWLYDPSISGWVAFDLGI